MDLFIGNITLYAECNHYVNTNPGWFAPILFRADMIRTSLFRTSIRAKHFTVLRYFSRVIIVLKLIITYIIRIEINYKTLKRYLHIYVDR